MKTLRLVGYLFMVTLLSVGFVSCSSDDDDDPVNDKQLISVVENGENFRVDFTHDAQGRLTKFVMDDYGDESIYSFQYSDNQIIHTEKDQGGTYTTTYTLKDGRIVSKKDYHNETTEYSYKDGQLSRIVNDGRFTMDFTWENGNIIKVVEEDDETHTFTYSDISHRFVYMTVDIFDSLDDGGSFIDDILFQLGYFGKSNKNLPTKGVHYYMGDFSFQQAANYTLDNGMVSKVTCTDDEETSTYVLNYQNK